MGENKNKKASVIKETKEVMRRGSRKAGEESRKGMTIVDKPIQEFFATDYNDFAKYVICSRACPSLIDGFKVGARKIMHAAFNGACKNGSTVKLLNLSGDTLKLSLYAHGDASLSSTIITLASDYNYNLNPLTIEGQYGTLRSPDASSPRYLYVKLSKYANSIYKKDYDLLEYVFDEDEWLEPKYYLPIIPTVLTHLAEGMAPGYRFSSMAYSPIDVIDNCIEYLKKGTCNTMVHPYLHDIKQSNWEFNTEGNYWVNKGEWSYNKAKDLMIVTDLPYDIEWGAWEKMLNKYVESGYIKDWRNFSEGNNIKYSIQFGKGQLAKEIGHESVDTHIPNKFKLIKRMPDDLLWVLDENDKVKHFDSPNELIEYFVKFRLAKYTDRKTRMVKVLNEKLQNNNDLCKFIDLVIKGKLKINNRPRADIKADMKAVNLPDSLLSVSISKLTKEEYEALLKENESIKQELDYIINTTEKDMYLKDLKDLRKEIAPDFPIA